MNPVQSTAEILAFKVLNRDIERSWIDWAIEMLMAGYETEHLIILAGETEPYNQFRLQELSNKVLFELNLDHSDKDLTIKKYATYLINKSLAGEIENVKVLEILKDICIELDYQDYLYDFFSLFFAKDDFLFRRVFPAMSPSITAGERMGTFSSSQGFPRCLPLSPQVKEWGRCGRVYIEAG